MLKTGKLHKFIIDAMKGAAGVVGKKNPLQSNYTTGLTKVTTMQKSLFMTCAWAHQLSYKDTIRETSIGVSDNKVVTTSSETICDYKAYCKDICYKVISHNGFDQIGGR